MQRGDLLAQVLDLPCVRHHVVGDAQPCGTLRLGSQRCLRLLAGDRVPCHESFDLYGLWRVHDQDTIDMVASATLGQQWNHEHLIGSGLRRGDRLAFHCCADGRMQDCLEPGACRGVAEDDLAQPTPIEPAVRVEYVTAEGLCDCGQRRLAGLDLLDNKPADARVRYEKMIEANPKSDDMVVAIGHQDGTGTSGILSTVPYDGTSRTWGARVQHATDLYGDVTKNRPFDVMWDPLSSANSVMLVYSVSAPVSGNNLLYARSSTGGLTFDSPGGISTHQAHWVQVERDPQPEVDARARCGHEVGQTRGQGRPVVSRCVDEACRAVEGDEGHAIAAR